MSDATIHKNQTGDDLVIRTMFRAEAVCASLLESGLSMDQLTTRQKGSFKKSFRPDADEITLFPDANKPEAEVILNRDGLYDRLPEGLFHQTRGSSKTSTVGDAVAEHRRFKEEERQARRFFGPLEQMLFRYRIYTEQGERQALYNLGRGRAHSSLYAFWNLTTPLPEPEGSKMIRLMPYANFIKGNRPETAEALSFLLDREVILKQKVVTGNGGAASEISMGQTRLGLNAVLGKGSNDLFPKWIFLIKGVGQKELPAYVKGQPMGDLLQKFADIFIPLEVDVDFEFETIPVSEGEAYESILGYGCCI